MLLLENDWAEWGQDEPAAAGEAHALSGSAIVDSYTAHRVVIRANVARAGFLVLADTYYPAWQATVDGRPAHVFRANVSQRAVYLREGDHEVVFEFRSKALRWGAILSAVSLFLLLMGLIAVKRSTQEG